MSVRAVGAISVLTVICLRMRLCIIVPGVRVGMLRHRHNWRRQMMEWEGSRMDMRMVLLRGWLHRLMQRELDGRDGSDWI